MNCLPRQIFLVLTEQNPQETPHIDPETLESLQRALYTRLREPLFSEVRERLLQEAAEKPIPLYYDRSSKVSLARRPWRPRSLHGRHASPTIGRLLAPG
ncbi:MAG: hypothetical protein ACE5LU_21485 [Anaerolineae bacterium]